MTNGKASLKQQLMISWKLISIIATLNLPSLLVATDPANSNPSMNIQKTIAVATQLRIVK